MHAGSDGSSEPPAAAPAADPERLAADPGWRSSRFAELERFMVDFLVGGAAGGESARLKLETPLFVADTLLGAAARQLAAELAAAEQVRAEALDPFLSRRGREKCVECSDTTQGG